MALNSITTNSSSAQVGLNAFSNISAGPATNYGAAFSVAWKPSGSAGSFATAKQPADTTGFLSMTALGEDSATATSSIVEQAPAWLTKLYR